MGRILVQTSNCERDLLLFYFPTMNVEVRYNKTDLLSLYKSGTSFHLNLKKISYSVVLSERIDLYSVKYMLDDRSVS